jgi:Pectate lyase superfamily protein
MADTVWDALGQAKTPSEARTFIGAVEEAPLTGEAYLRQSGAWLVASTSLQHNQLGGRSVADAHPVSAVTGLQNALDGKAPMVHTHVGSDISGITATQVSFSPSETIAATNVQAALAELDSETQASLALKSNITTTVTKTSSVGAANIPAGLVTDRPAAPVNGQFRYNATDGVFEGYTPLGWNQVSLFKQAGAGAVIRSAQDKMRESISVKDFGAVGDGVIDDTAAIALAIAYAKTFALGCEIVFPVGSYLYSSIVVDGQFITLRGEGAESVWLLKSGTTGDGVKFQGASRQFGNGIFNIVFAQASATATAGAQLSFVNCDQFDVMSVVVRNLTHDPFVGIQFSGCSQANNLSNLELQSCLSHGLYATDCIDLYLVNSRSDYNGGNGFYFSTCSGVYAANLTAYHNAGAGVAADSVAAQSFSDGNKYHFYTNCVSDSSGSHNWILQNLDASTFSNCWAATQHTSTYAVGFLIDICTNIGLSNCIALNNNAHGLFAQGACNEISITGGKYYNNGKVFAGNGIQIECPNVIVNGASCTDTQGSGSKTQYAGIGITAGCNQATIVNSRFVGNKTLPYDIVTSSMVAFFEDNNIADQSYSIPSAGTLILPVIGKLFTITGTTTINVIGFLWPQRSVTLLFADALVVGSGGQMRLAGNFNTTSGDTLSMISDGGSWFETSRSVNV